MTKHRHLKINEHLIIANDLPLVLIAGPCQVESREHSLKMAEELVNITNKLGMGFIYKSSFDKANRTSIKGKRGVGLEKALDIFAEIKEKFACPIVTDVHNEAQCAKVASVVDVLQIPAFLCRQTDLLAAAAATGKVVNIKKGQFLAPWDVVNIVEKMDAFSNQKILLTERGVCFGYNTLISDMRGLSIMAETGVPIIFDATHSSQRPGGQGKESGGERKYVPILARAAVAVGVAGLFIETHQDPDNAPSDGPCMIKLNDMPKMLAELMQFDKLSKNLYT